MPLWGTGGTEAESRGSRCTDKIERQKRASLSCAGARLLTTVMNVKAGLVSKYKEKK